MNRKLGGGLKLGVSWAGKCVLCCFRACVLRMRTYVNVCACRAQRYAIVQEYLSFPQFGLSSWLQLSLVWFS